MISKTLAISVLNAALSTGADFAELFWEDTITRGVTVENGKVENLSSSEISGVGLRILRGLSSVYGHTNDVSRSALMRLANDLAASFDGERQVTVNDLTLKHVRRVHKKIRSYSDVSEEEMIALLKKTDSIIGAADSRIVRRTCSFNCNTRNILICNSRGEKYTDHRELGRLALMSVASENGKLETRFDGPGTRKGFEYFTDELDTEALAKHHAEKLILMLGARECPSGKLPVIIGNGWGGVIFHEACGHQMEATSAAKGLSVYAPLYGQKIGSELVTAYDDGTIPNAWGSNNMDDEGEPTKKNKLIDKGVLCSYLVDPFNARRMEGHAPNGCSRRQNYKFEPTSRMSNTFIAPGKSTKEEIIAATKLAVYAVSFNGGSVNPSTGEFNFGCSEAYLVKDGRITEPLRGATLIGKATEVLHEVDMVGNDLELGQGMCGSASGSVETNVGQPTVRFKELIVGGRGGSIDEL